MLSVIDVGGGLRGIYGAGVFDRFIDEGINFDLCIGVSAGSANVASFLACQKGRNYRFYRDYSQRKEYMSFHNFIKHGSYIDLNYVYATLTNSDGEDPICYENIKNYNGEFLIVSTDAVTGKSEYFTKNNLSQDNYSVFSASSCLPFVCRPIEINGKKYFDGGVSDPAPLEKAIEKGSDKIILILTKPKSELLSDKRNKTVAKIIEKKYPETAKMLRSSHEKYNSAVKKAMELEKEGKLLIIAPDDCCGVKTLTKDKEKLRLLYEKGYDDAEKAIDFLK